MTIGVVWNLAVDQQTYDAVSEKVMQAAIDKGLQFHAAGGAEDGRWRIIDVWQSREGLEKFIREDLATAFNEIGDGQADTPQPETLFAIHVQGP